MYYLYHINGLNYIEIRDGMCFGRNNGTKTFPDDHKMSGEHCRFKTNGDDVYVEDLNSKNRTVLDRIELIPGKQIQMKLMGVLEAGSQRFIMTDHNLTIQEINDILNSQQGLQVAKLEGAKLIQERQDRIIAEVEELMDNEQKLNAILIEKKFKLADAKRSIINLAKETEEELRKLDEEKAKILNSIVDK